MGRAALEGAARLDEVQTLLSTDLVWAALSGAAKEALEALMIPEGYQYQTEFVRKIAADLARNKAEAKAEGERSAVLKMIERKFGELTEDQRQRLSEQEPDDLIDRFFSSATLEELLG